MRGTGCRKPPVRHTCGRRVGPLGSPQFEPRRSEWNRSGQATSLGLGTSPKVKVPYSCSWGDVVGSDGRWE